MPDIADTPSPPPPLHPDIAAAYRALFDANERVKVEPELAAQLRAVIGRLSDEIRKQQQECHQ